MKTPRPLKTKRRSSRRSGQEIVEFAFVVPILLALFIGIMEFGWLVKNNMTLSSAAREGARAAAVGRTTSDIEARIARYANPISLTSPDGSVTLQQCDSTGSNCSTWPADIPASGTAAARNGVTPPNMVRVTLTSRHRSLTRFIPGIEGRTVTAVVTMRREA